MVLVSLVLLKEFDVDLIATTASNCKGSKFCHALPWLTWFGMGWAHFPLHQSTYKARKGGMTLGLIARGLVLVRHLVTNTVQ